MQQRPTTETSAQTRDSAFDPLLLQLFNPEIPEFDECPGRIFGMSRLQADRARRSAGVADVNHLRAVVEHDNVIAVEGRFEYVPLIRNDPRSLGRLFHIHDAAREVFAARAIGEYLVSNLQLVPGWLRPPLTQHQR